MLATLKTAEQFAAVLEASKQKGVALHGIWRSPHFVLHRANLSVMAHPYSPDLLNAEYALSSKQNGRSMIGVVAPKRWAKRAVTRNAIKRQVYAVSNELAAQLPTGAYIVRLSKAYSKEQFKSASSLALKRAVRLELLSLFSRALMP